MKKLFALLALVAFMFSCDSKPDRYEVYESMTPPVIVVAKSERVNPKLITENGKTRQLEGMRGTIVLQDSKGISVTFTDTDKYGNALHASYQKGDTLLSLVK